MKSEQEEDVGEEMWGGKAETSAALEWRRLQEL